MILSTFESTTRACYVPKLKHPRAMFQIQTISGSRANQMASDEIADGFGESNLGGKYPSGSRRQSYDSVEDAASTMELSNESRRGGKGSEAQQ